MKKFFISFAFALMAIAANAQTVNISTFAGTNMAKFDGQVKDIKISRILFKGWNTISLPFSMTESQLNEYFGSDCRLEKLTGASQAGNTISLNFTDVKSQGLMANTPYVLYFNQETKYVSMNMKSVRLEDSNSQVYFTTQTGATVTMNGANQEIEKVGLYGIRVADNQDVNFTEVSSDGPVFYATRCYIQVEGADGANLVAVHNAAGTTGIQGVNAAGQNNETVYNLAGQRTSKNAKGVKIINGKKTF